MKYIKNKKIWNETGFCYYKKSKKIFSFTKSGLDITKLSRGSETDLRFIVDRKTNRLRYVFSDVHVIFTIVDISPMDYKLQGITMIVNGLYRKLDLFHLAYSCADLMHEFLLSRDGAEQLRSIIINFKKLNED